MTKFKVLGAAAVLASALAGPALAQEVILNPGKCAQYYPNANCQNYGHGNPYRGTYHQRSDSYNRWDGDRNSGFGPADVAAATATAASGRPMSQPASLAARSAPRRLSLPRRSAPTPMRVRTALSACPVPGSAAKTAAGISASKAFT
jgi:hypothetical protein